MLVKNQKIKASDMLPFPPTPLPSDTALQKPKHFSELDVTNDVVDTK